MKRRLKSWIAELRAPFLTATLVSIVLGTAIAWARRDMFNLEYFLLALLGGMFLHLGANVANDYFDYRSGNDSVNKEFVRPFSGGSRMIQLGLLTPREVLSGALLFYTLATLVGLYLAWTKGPFIIVLGLAGMVSGFFYSAPLFNWASRGVGEILVGANFGALMTLGAYYVQTETVTIEPLLASIPVSLLIAAVLYINEFPDYVADKTVGKNTLVVRLSRAKGAYGYMLLVVGAYFFVLLNVVLAIAPSHTVLGLVTFPLAVEAIRYAIKFHSKPLNLVPANALTITFHFLTSLLISVGYLIYRCDVASLGYLFAVLIVGLCALFSAYFYLKFRLHPSLVET